MNKMRWCALVTVVGAGAAIPAFAAGGSENVSRYCRDHNDFGLSHGACIALFQTGNTTPHNADVCKMAWVRSWVGAENEGECVKTLNAMTR